MSYTQCMGLQSDDNALGTHIVGFLGSLGAHPGKNPNMCGFKNLNS